MLSTGVAGIMGGYLLGLCIPPMIERISTGSFVIFSGGWCLLAMGLSYLFVDILRFRKVATFFAIVGMNPIFIYLFSSLGGKSLLTRMARPFTYRLFGWGRRYGDQHGDDCGGGVYGLGASAIICINGIFSLNCKINNDMKRIHVGLVLFLLYLLSVNISTLSAKELKG